VIANSHLLTEAMLRELASASEYGESPHRPALRVLLAGYSKHRLFLTLNVGPFYLFPPNIKSKPNPNFDLPWQKFSLTLLVLRNSVAVEVVARRQRLLQLKYVSDNEENKTIRERRRDTYAWKCEEEACVWTRARSKEGRKREVVGMVLQCQRYYSLSQSLYRFTGGRTQTSFPLKKKLGGGE
jgi:hypothetical protein